MEELTDQQVSILRHMGGMTFDAVIEETHTAELTVTENPVETGVTVSDHAVMQPLTLSIRAVVSDTPLASIGNDAFESDTGRSKKAFELLTELQKTAEPFDVQTGLKLYQNMVCISISVTQDKDTAKALFFEAALREVIIVDTTTVKYPPRAPGATTRQSAKTAERGTQQAKDEPAKKPPRKSILKSAI